MGKTDPGRNAEGSGEGQVSSAPREGLAQDSVSGEAQSGSTAPSDEPNPEALRALEAELEPYFPAPFDETELVLMDVDPRRVHAYWHVSADDLEAAGIDGPPPLVLRVYDVTGADAGGPDAEFFDVDVQGLESRCYVDLWQPGRAYEAELAVRGPDGTLRTLARSNRAQTPVDTADLAQPHGEAPRESSEAEPPAPVDPPALAATPRSPTGESPAAAAHDVPPGRSEGPPAAPSVPAPVDEGGRPADSPDGPLAPPAAPGGGEPALRVPAVASLAPEFPNPAPEAGAADAAGAAAPAWASRAGVDGALLPPAGGPAPVAAALGEVADAGGAPLVTLSSSSLAESPVVLEVHAELHVFGRARPGSRLRIFGRPVALRPDGSFSVRRPLPAGAVVLPLELEEPAPGVTESPEGT